MFSEAARLWWGGIGLALLAIAAAITVYDSFTGDSAQSCPKPLAAAATDNLEITGIGPVVGQRVRLQLGSSVCIVAANVVPPEAIKSLDEKEKSARRDLKEVADLQKETDAALRKATTEEHKTLEDRAKLLEAQTTGLKADIAAIATELSNARQNIKIALFVNGKPTGATFDAFAKSEPQPLTFSLQPTADAKEDAAAAWRAVLADVRSGDSPTVELGIGRADATRPAPQPPAKLPWTAEFATFNLWGAIAGGAAIIALVLWFAALAATTGILRDGGVGTAYSLARVQMAFWLFVSLASFVLIWVATGQYRNVVTASTFTLLGIAGATGFVARQVDANEVPLSASTGFSGFFQDLFSDGTGPQLHRVQIAAWTVVLGAIFIWNVASRLVMTEFDANLLILAGIAGGVYAGLKTQETPAAGLDRAKDSHKA